MSEWKDYYLGDVVDYKKGFAFKSNWYQRQGRYIVRVSDTTLNSINIASCNCISEELASQFEIYSLLKDDVIIATVGSWPNNPSSVVGKVVKVPNEANGALLNQNAVRLRGNEKIDNKFLYYLLKSNQFSRYIVSKAQGSANQASITLKDIIHYSFKAPELEEQSLIANFLYALDDKIAVNRRICENLEAQAQALFKHWFIDFAPFKNGQFVESELGMIPEGWRVGTLTDILDNIKDTIKQGDNTELPYLPIDSIPMKSFLVNEVKDNSEAQSSLILFKKYDILVGAMRVYFHRVVPAPFDGITRSTCFVLRPVVRDYYSFALCCVNSNKAIQHAQKTSKGSTMPYAVWEGGFGTFNIVIPPESVAREFDVLIKKDIEMIQTTYFENLRLSTLRDTLLPKLMSGQIKV